MAAMDVDCRHLIKVLIISLLGFERVWLECRVVSKDRSRQWNRPAHRVLQTSSFVANARPILACFSKKAQAKSSYFAKVPTAPGNKVPGRQREDIQLPYGR